MKLTADHIFILEDRPIDCICEIYRDEFYPDGFKSKSEQLDCDEQTEKLTQNFLRRVKHEKKLTIETDFERWLLGNMIHSSTCCCSLRDCTGEVPQEHKKLFREMKKAGESLSKWYEDTFGEFVEFPLY